MNELIKYFNKEYSKTHGKIAYPRTTLQIYQVYQIIKSFGIEDEKLNKLLDEAILPKPKTTEEKEAYAECIYESVNIPASRKYVDGNFPKKTSIEDNKLYLIKENGEKIDEGTELPSSNINKEYIDTSLKNKVDKVTGKGLSTVDFTKSYETKLKGLENYNDTKVKEDIKTINTQLGDIANLFTTEQTTNSYKIKCGNKVIAEIPLGSTIPTVIKYTITNTLSNATNSNSATEIEENQPYTAIITANEGYSINSVTIAMGGNDITNTVYNEGSINIPNVTGDLVITAECIEIVTSVDNEKLLDMDLTGLNDGSVTSFTNTVSNDVAVVDGSTLNNIRNSVIDKNDLINENALTYAYIFNKNNGNPSMFGYGFTKYYNKDLYGWDSYGLNISIICNTSAATGVNLNNVCTIDLKTLPDVNFAVVTLNNDGTLDCYLNGKLLCHIPKQDIWESWQYQCNGISQGRFNSINNGNGSLKPIEHMYIYKGSLTSTEVSYLNDFFHKN